MTIAVTGVTQDEPVTGGDDTTSPDAVIQGSTVPLRVERYGTNGRVRGIPMTAAALRQLHECGFRKTLPGRFRKFC